MTESNVRVGAGRLRQNSKTNMDGNEEEQWEVKVRQHYGI